MPKVTWIETDRGETYVDRVDVVEDIAAATKAIQAEMDMTATAEMTEDLMSRWNSKANHPQRANGLPFEVTVPNGAHATTTVRYEP